MKIPHIDYKPHFDGDEEGFFCRKCGDVYLVDWDGVKWGLKCTNCGEIK